MPRLWVQSLWGLLTRELSWMILVGSFQPRTFCRAVRSVIPGVVQALFVPGWLWGSRCGSFPVSSHSLSERGGCSRGSAESLVQVIAERSIALLLRSCTFWKIGSQTIQEKRGAKASLFHAKWAGFFLRAELKKQWQSWGPDWKLFHWDLPAPSLWCLCSRELHFKSQFHFISCHVHSFL